MDSFDKTAIGALLLTIILIVFSFLFSLGWNAFMVGFLAQKTLSFGASVGLFLMIACVVKFLALLSPPKEEKEPQLHYHVDFLDEENSLDSTEKSK